MCTRGGTTHCLSPPTGVCTGCVTLSLSLPTPNHSGSPSTGIRAKALSLLLLLPTGGCLLRGDLLPGQKHSCSCASTGAAAAHFFPRSTSYCHCCPGSAAIAAPELLEQADLFLKLPRAATRLLQVVFHLSTSTELLQAAPSHSGSAQSFPASVAAPGVFLQQNDLQMELPCCWLLLQTAPGASH